MFSKIFYTEKFNQIVKKKKKRYREELREEVRVCRGV